jgi:hypothetical protein
VDDGIATLYALCDRLAVAHIRNTPIVNLVPPLGKPSLGYALVSYQEPQLVTGLKQRKSGMCTH